MEQRSAGEDLREARKSSSEEQRGEAGNERDSSKETTAEPEEGQIISTNQESLEAGGAIIIQAIQRLYAHATRTASRSRFLYARILQQIREQPTQLATLEDLKNIRFVGDSVFRRICTAVQHLLGRSGERPVRSQERTTQGRTSSSQRLYIPAFRSAPYAILRALYALGSAHKHLIALRAAPFTDAEFRPQQRFSAFSAFKQLVRRALIQQEGRGSFSLTEAGLELCERLFTATADKEIRTTTQEDAVDNTRSRRTPLQTETENQEYTEEATPGRWKDSFSAKSHQPNKKCSKYLINEDEHEKYLTEMGKNSLSNHTGHSQRDNTTDTLILAIDTREKRASKDRLFFQEFFTTYSVPHTTRFLGLGDFLWLRNERIVGTIVERKAGSDLLASLADGRFREQKRRLRDFLKRCLALEEKRQAQTGWPPRENTICCYYIVEGVVRGSDRKAVEDALEEARGEGMVVIETESAVETGRVLMEIDARLRHGSDLKNAESAEDTENGCAGSGRHKKEEDSQRSSTRVPRQSEENESAEVVIALQSTDKLVSTEIKEEKKTATTYMSYGSFLDDTDKQANYTPADLLFAALLTVRGLGRARAAALASRFGSIGRFCEVCAAGLRIAERADARLEGVKEEAEALFEELGGGIAWTRSMALRVANAFLS